MDFYTTVVARIMQRRIRKAVITAFLWGETAMFAVLAVARRLLLHRYV